MTYITRNSLFLATAKQRKCQPEENASYPSLPRRDAIGVENDGDMDFLAICELDYDLEPFVVTTRRLGAQIVQKYTREYFHTCRHCFVNCTKHAEPC